MTLSRCLPQLNPLFMLFTVTIRSMPTLMRSATSPTTTGAPARQKTAETAAERRVSPYRLSFDVFLVMSQQPFALKLSVVNANKFTKRCRKFLRAAVSILSLGIRASSVSSQASRLASCLTTVITYHLCPLLTPNRAVLAGSHLPCFSLRTPH